MDEGSLHLFYELAKDYPSMLSAEELMLLNCGVGEDS